jgi:hypothetical protein
VIRLLTSYFRAGGQLARAYVLRVHAGRLWRETRETRATAREARARTEALLRESRKLRTGQRPNASDAAGDAPRTSAALAVPETSDAQQAGPEGELPAASVGAWADRARALLGVLEAVRILPGGNWVGEWRPALVARSAAMAAVRAAGRAIARHPTPPDVARLGRILACLGTRLHAAEAGELLPHEYLALAADVRQLCAGVEQFVSGLPAGSAATGSGEMHHVEGAVIHEPALEGAILHRTG